MLIENCARSFTNVSTVVDLSGNSPVKCVKSVKSVSLPIGDRVRLRIPIWFWGKNEPRRQNLLGRQLIARRRQSFVIGMERVHCNTGFFFVFGFRHKGGPEAKGY